MQNKAGSVEMSAADGHDSTLRAVQPDSPTFCGVQREGRAGQDRIVTFALGDEIRCFAVFDGHGADFFSAYLKEYLPAALREEVRPRDFPFPQAVQRAVSKVFYHLDRRVHDLLLECWLGRDFSRLDELALALEVTNYPGGYYFRKVLEYVDRGEAEMELAREEFFSAHGGSTAVLSMQKGETLYLVNLGDSRALFFDPKGFTFTIDHKPGDPEEARRIREAGGFVVEGRVGGRLALSRAFGDYSLKYVEGIYNPYGPVSVLPDVYPLKVTPGAQLLLASDGLFDVLKNEDIYSFMLLQTKGNLPLARLFCQALVDKALRMYLEAWTPTWQIDDISLWIVSL